MLVLAMVLPCSIYLTFTLQTMYKIINRNVRYSDQIVTNSTFLFKKKPFFAQYIEQNCSNCYKIVNKTSPRRSCYFYKNKIKSLYIKKIIVKS
ncbi:hypothetical protein ELS82_05325 [Vibrio ouci]|uniref:Uncharacterized protein n=1 Tax=Vibrio ouci TaxID=2499078 RepID=A0A4Y8WIH8_9VIBR|nr:hypothetical protein ELS82_05325 [Vibrio ouci]